MTTTKTSAAVTKALTAARKEVAKKATATIKTLKRGNYQVWSKNQYVTVTGLVRNVKPEKLIEIGVQTNARTRLFIDSKIEITFHKGLLLKDIDASFKNEGFKKVKRNQARGKQVASYELPGESKQPAWKQKRVSWVKKVTGGELLVLEGPSSSTLCVLVIRTFIATPATVFGKGHDLSTTEMTKRLKTAFKHIPRL
jgi:hypothetical protein